MSFDIKFSDDLTLNIRDCPHLLIVGKGDNRSKFAEQLEKKIDSVFETIEILDNDKYFSTDFKSIGVDICFGDYNYTTAEKRLNERYELLATFNCNNIEQYNEHFKYEGMYYLVALTSWLKGDAIDSLKQILMKGRAVGIHVIVFADSVADFGDNTDLLDYFFVKLVYSAKNAKESKLLTGYAGAEKLKDDEFMLSELGKQPVIYKSKL